MVAQASASTSEDILKFTFEYANHPTSITLNASYVAPANTNEALYDSGDGVWRPFTSRTIPVLSSSNYVAFKGDWRKSGGGYSYMFSSSFLLTNSRCRTSGRFAYAPTNNASAYYSVFDSCIRITSFDDNPFQPITGSPAANMFRNICYSMNGLTNLPAGFLDTSRLTGAPAADMFNSACNGLTGVTNLPDGFMNTSGLTGAPAANMFYAACQSMFAAKNIPSGFMNTSGLTGAPAAGMFYSACYGMSSVKTLPAGFMNTSGLTGAPAAQMFQQACREMSGVTNLPAGFLDTSGLTGAPAANMFNTACQNMSGVTTLPAGFMDTRGLTGSPAADMFRGACSSMGGVTNLPAGFLDTSGLTGAPAANMFNTACQNMSGVISGDINISSNVTFATTNVASSMPSAFASMTKWTGTVYWGTARIYDAITNPATDGNVFQNSTNVPGYTSMGGNWK
jgi:hypothetical protein